MGSIQPKRSKPELLIKEYTNHCGKSVHIRSYSGPHFLAFGLRISPYSVRMRENADQNNSEYGYSPSSEMQKMVRTICATQIFQMLDSWGIIIFYKSRYIQFIDRRVHTMWMYLKEKKVQVQDWIYSLVSTKNNWFSS